MILRLLPGGEEQQIWTAPLTRSWTITPEQAGVRVAPSEANYTA
jgi:hypothetical protein